MTASHVYRYTVSASEVAFTNSELRTQSRPFLSTALCISVHAKKASASAEFRAVVLCVKLGLQLQTLDQQTSQFQLYC